MGQSNLSSQGYECTQDSSVELCSFDRFLLLFLTDLCLLQKKHGTKAQIASFSQENKKTEMSCKECGSSATVKGGNWTVDFVCFFLNRGMVSQLIPWKAFGWITNCYLVVFLASRHLIQVQDILYNMKNKALTLHFSCQLTNPSPYISH